MTIRGDRYELRADWLPLLEGPLRDYSSFGAPYDIPDVVFLGDDTSRGAARAELARVEACAGDATTSPGGSLRVTRQGIELRLEVAGTGAAEYRVYRDASPRSAGTTLHVADPGPVLPDATSIPDGGTWYFVVRAVDGCGFEQE